MSQAAVEQVIGRLVIDRAFRELMQRDRQTALTEYDLTPGERDGLAHVDLHDFDQAVTGLDERVSKGVSLN